ncbi:MAG TPA: Xaa-Pro peptidase family protein, partial [Candidatus Competibacteraceae bacterium]|nr:Xaa-Pro peptidase family protein [Candidatus Competibacteraceae bacterium]
MQFGINNTPFEEAEFRARVANTKARMAAQGLDVLLVTDPANMNYLTGYDGWSFYVHQVVIVALNEEQPLWIGRRQDVNGARLTTVLPDERIIGYSDDYVQSTVKHPMQFVADQLKARGLARGTIGVEADAYYFTGKALDVLRAELSEASIEDAGVLVNWVRVVKSEREIHYMRQAARIVEHAMQAAVDSMGHGMRQCDVVAAIQHAQISGTPEYAGDYPAIVPLLPSGVGTSCPHVTWRDEPFVNDTGTIIEIAGVCHRYHCPLSRTVYLGKPPQKMLHAEQVVIEGIAAALEAAKPGALARDVHAAWNTVIERNGIFKESRCGYSTGLGFPPDWGEHTISLRSSDQ